VTRRTQWTPGLAIRATIYVVVVGMLLALSPDFRDAWAWLLGHLAIVATAAFGVLLALFVLVGIKVPKR
jgi:hypothetical protein